MLTQLEGNKKIGELIQSNIPFSIIRLRSETACLEWYLKNSYPTIIPPFYEINGGIYPLTKEIIKFYGKCIKEGIEECDYSVYWKMHDTQYKKFSTIKKIKLLHNRAVEPFYFNDPWSQYLEGKKVLIIHPFINTIKEQFNNREKIFSNSKILPPFILKTIKSIQTSGGGIKPHNNWMESLTFMKNSIKKEDFDIALLGCGCSDIPLSTMIKKMGRQCLPKQGIKLGDHMLLQFNDAKFA